MNYWGKVTNTINNIANTNSNSSEVMNELKRREKIIKDL